MDANPLTHQEIQAFSNMRKLDVDAWETDVLCRMDDAAVAAWRGSTKVAAPPPTETISTVENGGHQVSIKDTEGLKGLLRSSAAAKVGGGQPGRRKHA